MQHRSEMLYFSRVSVYDILVCVKNTKQKLAIFLWRNIGCEMFAMHDLDLKVFW